MADGGVPGQPAAPKRVDLHCHTSASFDGVADPVAFVRRAAERGLTHLAITDHDTLDGAFRARDAAPAGLTVLIGCEVNTPEGDLIVVFLERALPRGLSAGETIAAAREVGALVGIPHPFDDARRSLMTDPDNERLVATADWIEAWNGRVARGRVNERAATLGRRLGVPGIAVTDAHALLEVGTAWTTVGGDPSTRAGLRAALAGPVAPALGVVDGPGGGWSRWLPSRPGHARARR